VSAERKFHIALDETRLLMLGAQILYGFQFQSVFQEGMENASRAVRATDAAALLLMTVTVGLLIAPSARHRITSDGAISQAMFRYVRRCGSFALIPFSMSLALVVYIVLVRTFGSFPALASALALWLLAILFWFVLEMFCPQARREMVMTHIKPTPLNSKIDQLLTEARLTLPGAQALLGFQLIAMLTPSFDRLPFASKVTHACSLGFIAVSVILLMSPAAFHRIGFAGEDSGDFYRIGSRLVTAALLPLALGLSADIYVAVAKLLDKPVAGMAAAGFSIMLSIGLWYAYPLLLKRERRLGEKDKAAEPVGSAAR
jgi:hypothetical protein